VEKGVAADAHFCEFRIMRGHADHCYAIDGWGASGPLWGRRPGCPSDYPSPRAAVRRRPHGPRSDRYSTYHYSTYHYSTYHYSTYHYSTYHYSTYHYSTYHYSTYHYSMYHYSTYHRCPT